VGFVYVEIRKDLCKADKDRQWTKPY